MTPEEKHRAILRAVCDRFVSRKEPITRWDLVNNFEDPDILDPLKSHGFLKQIGTNTEEYSYLPTAATFYNSGEDYQSKAKRAAIPVLSVMRTLYKDPTKKRIFITKEFLSLAQEILLEPHDDETLIFGLYLASDLRVLGNWSMKNEVEMEWFKISEAIVKVKDPCVFWEQRMNEQKLEDFERYRSRIMTPHFDVHKRETTSPTQFTATEAAIMSTLEQIHPKIALSYKQVIQDLSDLQRSSYRGVAAELREVLRELLDYLAPDEEVLKTVTLEPEQQRPSMKQRTGFALRKQGVAASARKMAEDAVSEVEDRIGALTRSVYDRGSAAAHAATTRGEVMRMKGFADAVLAELLQVHK
jgi:hypothetical protein